MSAGSRLVALTHLPSPDMDRCEVTYVTRAPIDYPRALAQHAAYRQMLAECGAEVVALNTHPHLPDCVFVEDTAVVLDEVAVLCSMGAPSRRGEPAGLEPELRRHRPVLRLELPATLDGGDVTRVGRTLLVGRSARSNAAGQAALASLAEPHGYRVRSVGLRDCLHLKSACTPLPDGRLLINPRWLDTRDLEGFPTVPIPPQEPFAADVLSIGPTVCMAAAHPATADMVARLGFGVRTVDLSEFAKAEGGVTCLSILIPHVGGAAS
jgi:dimethylargininase